MPPEPTEPVPTSPTRPDGMPVLPDDDDDDADTVCEPTPLWEPKPTNPLDGLNESRPAGRLKPYPKLPRGTRGRRRLA